MATIESEIPVICYELPPYDPRNPGGLQATLAKPSPLETFTGRFGRKADKLKAREQLTSAGQNVHAINWGQHPDTGVDCLVVYLWAEGAAPPSPEQKPAVPPPRTRRTATSRRNKSAKVKP